MKLTTQEFDEWSQLCELEAILDKRVSVLNLNLVHRQALLDEVSFKRWQLEEIEKARLERREDGQS